MGSLTECNNLEKIKQIVGAMRIVLQTIRASRVGLQHVDRVDVQDQPNVIALGRLFNALARMCKCLLN
jgi:hypothetical protein